MDLIIFNKTNTITSPEGERSLRVSKNGGAISISKAAAAFLNLKAGTGTVFAQDRNDPKKWYFGISTKADETSFSLCIQSNVLMFRCTVLTKIVIDSYPGKRTSLKFLITKEPEKVEQGFSFYNLIPVLDEKPITKKKK